MSSTKPKVPCIICGNIALLMCQRCGEPYCNDDCQREDWQRHKYFCTVMPPLVALSPLKPVVNVPVTAPSQLLETCDIESKTKELSIRPEGRTRTRNSSNTSSDSVNVGRKEAVKLSMAWRECEKPTGSEFFECRVTHIEKEGPIWVIDVANTESVKRLSEKVTGLRPCAYKDLAVGNLVTITNDKNIYRAEILSLIDNPQGAELRLIDIGVVCSCDINNIYFSEPHMAELKAYAFRVKLPTNTGVQCNRNVTLRLLGSQTPDGIEQAQLKPNMSLLLSLPIQLLAINPDVNVVTIFQSNSALKEPQIALLQIKSTSDLNNDLNTKLVDKSAQPLTEPYPKVLAARTNEGFRRAVLLDFVESSSQFLVYEMDEGRITVTNEVRRIPGELLGHPLRVFAVILDEKNTGSLQKLLDNHNKNLSIKFQMENVQENEKNKLSNAQAVLMSNNEQVCAVRANTFMGRINELGHRYWREPVKNGSMVYITHLVDYQEVCISSVKTKHYAELFKSLKSKCLPFDQNSNVPIGSIVLVVCPDRGYYRAEVTGNEEGTRYYTVHNIDAGSVHRVPVSWLRMACRFLECLPVSQCRAKIKNICNIPSMAVPPNTAALQLLKRLYDQKFELEVEFFDADCSIIDLLDNSIDPPSLMTRMLPMMFTAAAVELQPAQNLPAVVEAEPEPKTEKNVIELPPLPPSPPSSPVQSVEKKKRNGRHYFGDLQHIPISISEQSKYILVLNCIGLYKTGYITACYFDNEETAEGFQNLLNIVNEYGSSDAVLPGYVPDVGELCLTLFAEDNTWYRSVCLEINDQSAHILYFDFGNSENVPLERIKPIPKKALHAIYATKCYIAGFDKTKNFIILEKYLAEKSKILCTVMKGPESDTRLINIPLMDKILSQELV